MRIAIRVDSSFQIGTGHMARCLALAEELRQKGAKTEFLCRDLPGNVAAWANRQGYPVHFLKTDSVEECRAILQSASPAFHALVVDHYQLDASFESVLRPLVSKLLVVDDLADRPHDANYVLDPNFGDENRIRYSKLVPQNTVLLMGPAYAMLRKEFSEARTKAEFKRRSVQPIERLLIFFGGVDLTDETSKTLDALELMGSNSQNLKVDVVLGGSNPKKEAIQKRLAGKSDYRCLVQVDNMAELIVAADLAIGAGGTASWERLCLGLPSLVISVADNQTQACIDLDKAGYLFYLGISDQVSKESLAAAIAARIKAPKENLERGQKAMQLVDGLGCEKIAKGLTSLI